MAGNDNNVNAQTSNGTSTAWQIVGRLIAAAIILAITAFFTPGFQINNIWSLAIAAVVLTVLDYLILALITKTHVNTEILLKETEIIISFLYLAIGGSGLAYLLQTVSQKYVSVNKTSILLNMEAFLGALCGVIFMGDKLTFNFVFGGILVISAIFICELGNNLKDNSNN